VIPAAIFAEIDGTTVDGTGQFRPLNKSCNAPGAARAEWRIAGELAQAMGGAGFDFDTTAAVAEAAGCSGAALWTDREEAPAPAHNPKLRRTVYRGHRISDKATGLTEVPMDGECRRPVVEALAKAGRFPIVAKQEIVPNTHELVIKAPEIAKKAQAGQFVIVMADQTAERVPYTLCDWDAEAGTITLVVLEKGQSSRKLILKEAGDSLAHVVGPLGIPFEVKNYGTVAVTGGCYGIGGIVSIAKALKAVGNTVISITEARSHYLHYYGKKLAAIADEAIQTTIDGSVSPKGHAVDALIQQLKDGKEIDCVVAIGCPFMMMLTADATRPYEVPTWAALNPIMLDGTGMCGACRLSVGSETKFACVDGPFFDAHLVDWIEVRDRREAYSMAEIQSVGKTESVTLHKHACACKSDFVA
jgi:NAD(P)H-flavin reductase